MSGRCAVLIHDGEPLDPALPRPGLVSDAIYERLTGEKGYFDTRIVFIAPRYAV